MEMQYKRYNDKAGHSYCFGPFPTFELLENRPERAVEVLYHSAVTDCIREKLERLCRARGIPCTQADRVIGRIRDKENCLVAGVFRKYEETLRRETNHIVLVSPSDMGNLGTIIRTSVGFGVCVSGIMTALRRTRRNLPGRESCIPLCWRDRRGWMSLRGGGSSCIP